MNKEQEMIPKREIVEQVGSVLKRLAMLHFYYAKTLLDELGDEEGRRVINAALTAYGHQVGLMARAKTLENGLEPIPENYLGDIPEWPWLSEGVIIDGEVRERVHHCPLASEWINLGDPAVGRLYCAVDQARMEAFNPECQYVHFRTIPDGDSFCECAVRPLKKA